MSTAGKTTNAATITYIISRSFINSAITLTKIFAEGFKDFELGGNNQIITEENVKEFKQKIHLLWLKKTEGSCTDKVYIFTVKGIVIIVTNSAITCTPTFSFPRNPISSCSKHVVTSWNGEETITYTITRDSNNSAITLTTLNSNIFNDVTLSDAYKSIVIGRICKFKPDNNNDNSNKN